MNYIKNQVARIELMIERRLEYEELIEAFRLIEDVYNDGVADRQGTTENVEVMTEDQLEKAIADKTGRLKPNDLETFI